jgi:hypothetical protein
MKCPLNAWFKMLAFSQGGPTTMVETYPDGHPLVNQYSFYRGYTQLLFEADKIGRHTLTFYAYGQQSNSIIVDVVPYSGPYTFGNVPPSGQPSSSSVSISIGYTGQGAGQTQGNGCDITGTWSFGTNGPYNIIYADGRIEAKNAQGEIFDTGTWNVIDASRRQYGFSWQSGWKHTFTLSADCSSLDGSGKFNGGTEQPGHGTRVSSSGSGGYSTTGTGNAGQGQGVGSDPFSTPGSILIDSADQGFDPNAHIGGLLTDSAEDLGYSTGGELI